MVKRFLTIISLFVFGIFWAINAFALNAPPAQGGKPDNWYIEVQLNTTTSGYASYSAAHGEVLEWDLDADTGETLGYTVHRCDTADAENVAGVVPSWDDSAHNNRTLPADGDTFLMQIRGYHSGLCAATAVTEGQSIEAAGVNGEVTDGDGLGFAMNGDAANDSSNKECGYGGNFIKAWIDFDKGTN